MEEDTDILGARQEFEETSWSLVRRAGQQEVLEKLCSIYWKPLYFFTRRQGYPNEEAKDLVQGFVVTLIERRAFLQADPARGKFRTFLLASLSNFIANRRKAARRQKRGGGRTFFSLDTSRVEREYLESVSSGEPPERALDRAWARNLWHQSLSELQGDSRHLEAFRLRMSGESYETITGRTGLECAAAESAVHRLRHQLRETVKNYIRQTVLDEGEIETELLEFESLLQ
jgi:RNA polymerase sigma-70 factor (ECF subfamily)